MDSKNVGFQVSLFSYLSLYTQGFVHGLESSIIKNCILKLTKKIYRVKMISPDPYVAVRIGDRSPVMFNNVRAGWS